MGTRLRPLTDDIPKPMVVIRGKPYLYYQLLYLKKFGFKDILLLVGYRREKIEEYFKDGTELGLSIKYSVEETPLGTGGALKNAQNLLENEFILINGDSFLPVNYTVLFNEFNGRKKKGMIVIYDNNTKDTGVKNNISIDDGFNVIKYRKGSADIDLKYVDAGVYMFSKDVLPLIEPDKTVSIEEEIYPLLIQKKELCAFLTRSRFYDIGTKERLTKFEEIINDYF